MKDPRTVNELLQLVELKLQEDEGSYNRSDFNLLLKITRKYESNILKGILTKPNKSLNVKTLINK